MDRDAIRLELVKLIYTPHITGELEPVEETISRAQKLESYIAGSPEPPVEPEATPPRRAGSRR